MSADIYSVGDLIRITAEFRDADGVLADPTAVIFHYKAYNIGQTTLTYGTDAAVVRSSTGVYYVELSATHDGPWYYRVEGTGAVQAAAEDYFTVRGTAFA